MLDVNVEFGCIALSETRSEDLAERMAVAHSSRSEEDEHSTSKECSGVNISILHEGSTGVGETGRMMSTSTSWAMPLNDHRSSGDSELVAEGCFRVLLFGVSCAVISLLSQIMQSENKTNSCVEVWPDPSSIPIGPRLRSVRPGLMS